MKAFSITVLVWFKLVSSVFSRPDGAPSDACSHLIPQHPPSVPLQGTGPFALNIAIPSVGYNPGDSYEFTFQSTEPNVTFRGFIIQARTQPGNDIVGRFIIVDDQTRVQACDLSAEDPVSPAGTITHNSRTDKSSVTLRWVALSSGTGDIQFMHSVVLNYTTYWVRIGSPLFFEDTGQIRQIDGLHYFECGSSRACFREPYDCRGATCTYAATWRVDRGAGMIEIEMLRNRRGWIALGFSDDNLMGDDDVFVCQSDIDGSSVLIKDTYNPSNYRYEPNMGERDQDDITSMEWLNVDTLILCRFRRTLSGNNIITDKDLSTGQYYMFFAHGNTIGDSEIDGVGGIHTDIPKITMGRRSPADVSVVGSDVEIVGPNTKLIKALLFILLFLVL